MPIHIKKINKFHYIWKSGLPCVLSMSAQLFNMCPALEILDTLYVTLF